MRVAESMYPIVAVGFLFLFDLLSSMKHNVRQRSTNSSLTMVIRLLLLCL